EKVIAVEYAFCEKHRLLFFQTGFDPEFKSLSPGHVLMSRMITDAIDQGVHEIDLLKGDYPYKANYASTTRESSVIHYLKVSGLVR
nr:GNAT family N-acetyltransferase [Gammaproteobacteria bacterium]